MLQQGVSTLIIAVGALFLFSAEYGTDSENWETDFAERRKESLT